MLSYLLDRVPGTGRCRVRLTGDITLDNARALLAQLWRDPAYVECTAALWDIGACEMPPFETLMRVTTYIVREKAGRGPVRVAFVSADFEQSILVRALQGFERLVGFDLNFFADEAAAQAWLDRRGSA
ncbi:MAG: hypothetical protein AB7Q81_16265 [Gammaproteobacteria bacterium]